MGFRCCESRSATVCQSTPDSIRAERSWARTLGPRTALALSGALVEVPLQLALWIAVNCFETWAKAASSFLEAGHEGCSSCPTYPFLQFPQSPTEVFPMINSMQNFATHRSLKKRVTASLAVLAVLLMVAGPAAAASDRWLHVKVDEEDGAKVNLNLPLSLIEMALEMVPEDVTTDITDEVRVELNDAGFNVEDLRNLWVELRDGGDATFLTVEEDDTKIAVRKVGDFFVAETVDGSETEVDVRFPAPVIDALFSGPSGTLDFAAAVRALADYSSGDMVTIRDEGTSVRIWIDSSNES